MILCWFMDFSFRLEMELPSARSFKILLIPWMSVTLASWRSPCSRMSLFHFGHKSVMARFVSCWLRYLSWDFAMRLPVTIDVANFMLQSKIPWTRLSTRSGAEDFKHWMARLNLHLRRRCSLPFCALLHQSFLSCFKSSMMEFTLSRATMTARLPTPATRSFGYPVQHENQHFTG